MGNSNPQQTIFNDPVQCEGSYSPFYGYHQLRGRQVIKRYHLQQNEKEAFQTMVENYRKIGFSKLIKIQSINRIRNDEQGCIYELQFPYYSLDLEEYLLGNSKLLGPQEALKLILTLLEILEIFEDTPFLFTALEPKKILLKDNSLQYSVGIDSLMNPHFLKKVNDNEEKQQKNRFQSPEKTKKNEKIDLTKSAIYSIGKIALWAMTRNDFKQQIPQVIAFQLRQKHSLQFCIFLESMLQQSSFDRIDLSLCLDDGYQLQEKIVILQQNFHKREFLRGYNSIESDSFLRNDVSFHAKSKWKKMK